MSVIACLGTRPEAIKLAPVILATAADPRIDIKVVSLGQHKQVCDEVLRFFEVPVDLRCSILRHGQSLARLSARCLTAVEKIFEAESPDLVLVQGDTTSAAMAALAAFYARVPVWHVEAGLRTSTTTTPFPEEMNRRLISRLASFHFAPTNSAHRNLRRESVPDSSILVTGNTGIDALHAAWARRRFFADPLLAGFVQENRRLLVVTMHRRENWGERIRRVGATVRELVVEHPDLQVVHAAHPNPKVLRDISRAVGRHPRILVAAPIDYGDFALLLRKASLLLTDSGGIQEEAPSLGVPVLVAREESERTEGLEAGFAQLVGTDPVAIANAVTKVLAGGARQRPRGSSNPYGDGHAAERIVAKIAELHSGMAQVANGRHWAKSLRPSA